MADFDKNGNPIIDLTQEHKIPKRTEMNSGLYKEIEARRETPTDKGIEQRKPETDEFDNNFNTNADTERDNWEANKAKNNIHSESDRDNISDSTTKAGENNMADKDQKEIDKARKKQEKEEKKANRKKWDKDYKKWFWKSFGFKLMWGLFLVSWIISVILLLWGMVAGFGATAQLSHSAGWALLAFGVVSLASIGVLIGNAKKDWKLWRKGFAKKKYLKGIAESTDGTYKFPDREEDKDKDSKGSKEDPKSKLDPRDTSIYQ